MVLIKTKNLVSILSTLKCQNLNTKSDPQCFMVPWYLVEISSLVSKKKNSITRVACCNYKRSVITYNLYKTQNLIIPKNIFSCHSFISVGIQVDKKNTHIHKKTVNKTQSSNYFFYLTKLLLLFNKLIWLFQKMSRLCFNKCVIKPGASLDSTEQVKLTYIIILHYFLVKCNYFKFLILLLEMCFNVYGPLHGNSESGVQILWWTINGRIPKYALNQIKQNECYL